MRPLGEAVYPTDRQVVCRLSIMAKGHCAWGVFVCNLPFRLFSFFLSFFFSCQLTHPFLESPLCLLIFLCYCFPSKRPKFGLSSCKLVQAVAKGPLWGCSTVWHLSGFLQGSGWPVRLPLWSRGAVFVCVRRRSGSRGTRCLKKQRRLLLFLSPFACLLAANLIREEKYTFCFYKAGLCL